MPDRINAAGPATESPTPRLTPESTLPSSAFARVLSRMTTRLGLTPAVVNSVLTRGWSVLAGPVSLIFVARFLSREEQGFYYTFWSVLGLQIVFELGFSFVISQFASHE